MNWNNKTVIVAMILCLSLVGCGGGGGSNGNPGAGSQPVTLSGIAAAGAPIAGIVNVKGANGATASSPIGSDGTYSIDVTDLTAPYILFAEGTVNGKSIKIFSAGVAAGTVNITPVTDFILRNALAGSAETAFSNWTTAQVSEAALSTAETNAQAQLGPLLNGAGVSSDINLLTTPFSANHTGLDAVLDVISISYNGNIATVKNNATGESFTDDITKIGDSAGFQGGSNTLKLADLAGTWYSIGLDTPLKGVSNPDLLGFDFDILILQNDGTGTTTCIASNDPCPPPEPFSVTSISPDGILTLPLDPGDEGDIVMGASKEIIIGIFRENDSGEMDLPILVKKAASYSMSDLVGTWYDMSIDTPQKGFSDADRFGFSFETITIEDDGSGVATCVSASEPCDPPEFFSGLSIPPDGVMTESPEPNVITHGVMGASKDVMIGLFSDNNTGNEFQAFGVQVKKGTSYSMADLAGTWYAININTPQTGISNPDHFGFDFDILTLQSDGTGTITCVASSDECETEPITGVSISSEGIVTAPLEPGQEQDMVMGANKDIMVAIFRDNNPGNEHQEFYIFVKKAE